MMSTTPTAPTATLPKSWSPAIQLAIQLMETAIAECPTLSSANQRMTAIGYAFDTYAHELPKEALTKAASALLIQAIELQDTPLVKLALEYNADVLVMDGLAFSRSLSTQQDNITIRLLYALKGTMLPKHIACETLRSVTTPHHQMMSLSLVRAVLDVFPSEYGALVPEVIQKLSNSPYPAIHASLIVKWPTLMDKLKVVNALGITHDDMLSEIATVLTKISSPPQKSNVGYTMV